MKKRLSEISEVRIGFPFRSRIEAQSDGNCAVVQMKDIDDHDLLHTENLARVHVRTRQGKIRLGDVIFKARGGRNTAAVVGADLESAIIAAPLMLIRLTDNTVLPAYLQWFLNHSATQRCLNVMPVSSTGRMISATALRELSVDIPSMDRQRTIVAVHHLQIEEDQLSSRLAAQRKVLCEELLLRHATQDGTRA